MNTNLIYVPIEPLTERYTEQWYRLLPEAFKAAGFDVTVIDGTPLLENEIRTGAFLDINSTVHYKMTQLQKISSMFMDGKIKHGTIFFFGDVEFWGIESVRLLAQMNKVKVYLTGFLHAASYTREDAFSIAAPYQKYTEVGWLAALDHVYVGSNYHKNQVVKLRLAPVNALELEERIKVTGNPLFPEEYHFYANFQPKKPKVLMTNRFDEEKRPLQTLALFCVLKQGFPDWEFVVTSGRKKLNLNEEALRAMTERGIEFKLGLTKTQYHQELEEAYMVVTHSIEENYGYCIAEALHYRCIPLMRSGLSHEEFIPKDWPNRSDFFFNSRDEALDKAWKWLSAEGDSNLPEPDYGAVGRIVYHLQSLNYQ